MGRFKAGDRVKILAGHPYHIGRDAVGEEMTGVVQSDEGKVNGRRGKYLVSVDGGTLPDYSFKGRVSSKTVDAGPVPNRPVGNFRQVMSGRLSVGSAFQWSMTKQGHLFWHDQQNTGLTHLGRAILRKWIAEAATTKEAA